jgi:hypothetical protein
MAPEQDVRAFAAALDRLLSDRQFCSQLGRQAQDRVRTGFCFEKYLDRLEGLLC